MSNQVNKAFVQQFRDELIHLSQQKGSRLRDTVRVRNVNGKYDHFDRLGAVAAQVRTTRHGDTPQIDTPHSRRRVLLADYEWADLIDQQDRVRMLIEPQNDYALAGSRALGRSMDDVLIAAATGNSLSIDSSDTSSNVALPAGQIIDEDFNTANSNLIVEKVIEAKRILLANDVDPDEDMFFIVNASAHASMLNENQIQSRDFNSKPALVDGVVDTYMGFKFIMTNRLLGTLSSEADPIKCLAYTKSALGLSLGQDVNVRISERDDKSYATQVYASMSIGATRIEDEKVVEVQCYQTA